MAEEQAKAVNPPAAAPTKEAGSPTIDIEHVTSEQLDSLFETGSAELPVVGGKDQSKKEAAPAKADEVPPAKVDEVPPVKVEEVVESRSPEEIESAVTEAVEKVKTDGGDQAAQDAAAEEARKPVAAQKVEEPPPAAKVEPAKVEEPEEKSRRFRVRNPLAQAALELYRTFENTDTPITLAEAEKRVRGGDVKKEEPPAQVPALATVVSTLEGEVADIKAKLVALDPDGGLVTPEITQLNMDYADKVADLKLARRDLNNETAAARTAAEARQAAFKKVVAESRARATESYPDVADDTTPLGKAVAEEIEAMRDPEHPDHNLLFTGSGPETIAKRIADKLGIQPVAKKAATPPPKKETPPLPKKVTPVSGAKSSAAKGPTPEDAKKTVEYLRSDNATLEDLDNFFGGDTNVLAQVSAR